MQEIKTILLTTDFSETSTVAFDYARDLARRFGARVVLAYVEPDRVPPMVVEGSAFGFAEILELQKEKASERLAAFAGEHLGVDVDVEPVVAVGTPHVEIVRLAEEHAADLIVMATHGRGFITHAILGSTTERVLRRARCPVFVVRERRAAHQPHRASA